LATHQRVRLSWSFPQHILNHTSDLLAAELSDDSDAETDADSVALGGTRKGKEKKGAKLEKHGIELKPCQHVFCGVSLLGSTNPAIESENSLLINRPA
jgi:hypothetical protein